MADPFCNPAYSFPDPKQAAAIGARPVFCPKCRKYHRDYTGGLPREREGLTVSLGEVANAD